MAARSNAAITKAALDALARVERDVEAAYPNAARLPALKAHLATVAMTVTHIRDEHERESGA